MAADYKAVVPAAWVNIGGHMGMAYYLLMFDDAVKAFFEKIGLGETYLQSGGTHFAVETHIIYEQELHAGDTVVIRTILIDADEKRLHFAQEICREGETSRVCLQELMYISIDQTTRRVSPWKHEAMVQIKTALSADNKLERPAKLGRVIGIKRISKSETRR